MLNIFHLASLHYIAHICPPPPSHTSSYLQITLQNLTSCNKNLICIDTGVPQVPPTNLHISLAHSLLQPSRAIPKYILFLFTFSCQFSQLCSSIHPLPVCCWPWLFLFGFFQTIFSQQRLVSFPLQSTPDSCSFSIISFTSLSSGTSRNSTRVKVTSV